MSQSTVFVSYSHKDEKEKNALLAHLGVLQHAGLIEVWNDDRIGAGQDWEQKISQAMAHAKVAILLITVNFLNSKFILTREVPELLNRRKNEGLIVFPLIAKDCAWLKIDWLSRMNVRPKNGTPIWRSGGGRVDKELTAIAEEVANIIEKTSSVPESSFDQAEQTLLPGTAKSISVTYESPKSTQTADLNESLFLQLKQAELRSDWQVAIELGERILALDAYHQMARDITARAYKRRGTAYHSINDYGQAIADYNRAIELEPLNADYYESRGWSHHMKGNYEQAINDYNRAIAINPNNADYYKARAWSYHRNDDYDQALVDYDRIIALEPNNADYYESRGWIYHDKGDYHRAIADYNRAIEISPNKAEYYFKRGESYLSIGDMTSAIADKKRAIEINPSIR